MGRYPSNKLAFFYPRPQQISLRGRRDKSNRHAKRTLNKPESSFKVLYFTAKSKPNSSTTILHLYFYSIQCHGANLAILEKANSRTLSFSPFLLALSPFPSHFFFFFLFLSDPTGQLLI